MFENSFLLRYRSNRPQNNTSGITDWPQYGTRHIYSSKLASGFAHYRGHHGDSEVPIKGVVKEHQAIFLFLHKIPVEQWLDIDFINIANVIAYAELYQILPTRR